MNRTIVYPGALPQDTDLLSPQRETMIALGFLARAVLGTSTVADGLGCIPTIPASMSVTVNPGSIFSLQTVDANPFGSLPADTADALVKFGINLAATPLGPFTAPATAGQSQNFLIQAAFSETDANPIVLPYYNASNPSVPFSGPSGSGTAQNTKRTQTVNLQILPGTPATTGSQTTPAPSSGFVGLWVITIANGQTSIVAGNIVAYPSAPFLTQKVPQLAALLAQVSTAEADVGITYDPSGATPNQLLQLIQTLAGAGKQSLTHAGSPYTLTASSAGLVEIDASGGNVIINLPAPASANWAKFEFELIRSDQSANTVTITTPSGLFLPLGAASFTIVAPYAPVRARADGTNYVATWVGGQSPSSLTANGWKKYPDPNSPTGYFIEQWGTGSIVVPSSGNFPNPVTLPIAFPTANLWAFAVWGGTAPPLQGNISASPLSNSQITIAIQAAAAGTFAVTYSAKGY